MPILADAKTLLGVGIEAEATLNLIIPGILSGADEYMGVRHSLVAAGEDFHDGGCATIYLRAVNVSNVAVYLDGELLDASYYAVYAREGKVKLLSGTFPGGPKRVRITYQGGYGEDALPAALRSKLLKQIGYEYRRRKDPGLSSVTSPDGTVHKFATGAWLPDVEEELSLRRRFYL
jgi:hypothetical protein